MYVFHFNEIHLSIFSSVAYAFGIITEKPPSNSKSEGFPYVFF